MSTKRDDTKIVNWVIYKITSPSGRIYIGKTSNKIARLRHYKNYLCVGQKILLRSLKKYSYDNHKFEIIDSFIGDNGYANSKEMFWIRSYMSNYCKWPEMRGMNLTDGGQGTIGRKATEDQRKKQSEKRKGRASKMKGVYKPTQETIEKIRATNNFKKEHGLYVSPRKGVKLTEDQKAHLSKINMGSVGYWKGKKFSEEHRKKLSKFKSGVPPWNKGKKMSEEARLNMSISRKGMKAWNKGIKSREETKKKLSDYWTGRPNINSRKNIMVYDKNYNFIKEVKGIEVASKEFNVSQSTILRQVKGKITKTRKYIFRYKKLLHFNVYSFNRRVFNMRDIKEKIA